MQFRKGESSDSFEAVFTYIFWRTDYEYNSANCRLGDFHGKNHENHGFWRLSQPIWNILQNVSNIICRPHRDTYFLSYALFSTIDSFRKNTLDEVQHISVQ